MELTDFKQAIHNLKNSDNTAILINNSSSKLDLYASACALASSLNDNIEIFSKENDFANLTWLSNKTTKQTIETSNHLEIELSEKTGKAGEIKYETNENQAKIIILPKAGYFSSEDVKIKVINKLPQYIITLGFQKIEEIETHFNISKHDLEKTFLINIDNNEQNTFFGKINLSNKDASSISEIVYDFLSQNELTITENNATLILAGIMSETLAFRNSKTSSHTLDTASRLMEANANHQLIVQMLYKSKDFNMVKLFGRILAKAKAKADKSILYSIINESDLEKASASESDLITCLQEIINHTSLYEQITILLEKEAETQTLTAKIKTSVVEEDKVIALYDEYAIIAKTYQEEALAIVETL